MKNKEIEYKYNAKDIKLSHFHNFCKTLEYKDFIEVAGTDHFYKNKSLPNHFYRFRVDSGRSELTLKIVGNEGNVTRDEYNIHVNNLSYETASDYVAEHGFFYSGKIYKTCFIYVYDCYILVYYVCYDSDMEELGRFIEIEMKEDHPWGSVKEAQDVLKMKEMRFKDLGINSKNRETKSLYQMFGGG